MRYKSLAGAVGIATALLVGGPAFAGPPGPSGSSESGNRLSCYASGGQRPVEGSVVVADRPGGKNVNGARGTTYVGTHGVETCNDAGTTWQYRIIISPDGGGYVMFDGATFPGDATPQDNGCYRATSGGLNQSC